MMKELIALGADPKEPATDAFARRYADPGEA